MCIIQILVPLRIEPGHLRLRSQFADHPTKGAIEERHVPVYPGICKRRTTAADIVTTRLPIAASIALTLETVPFWKGKVPYPSY